MKVQAVSAPVISPSDPCAAATVGTIFEDAIKKESHLLVQILFS
jgi:hypothetical protein